MPLTTTPRGDPDGIPMKDGYRCLIAFAAAPTVAFWEKAVKPPGWDGGDAIDTTTMHNDTVRTRSARALKTMTESTTKVAYDPKMYNTVRDLINVEGSITVHLPNGGTLDFFGFLQKFETEDLVEGTQPEANATITPTNQDPVTRAEVLPVYTPPTGT